MSDRRKTHLQHKQGAACGATTTDITTLLHQVTCGRCIRSIHMADHEAKAANVRRRKGTS